MNKKVITGILLTILALGLGYSIYEFFFVSFPRGILDVSFLWVAVPVMATIIVPIINFAVVYFSNKSRAKSESLFLASAYGLGLFVLLRLTTLPFGTIPMRVWAPVFVVVAIALIIASYLLTRKK